ncbi:hypothetical protein [Sulfobacillus harzensis]|uniref:Uncharacterized protein n=1 Tax=Sulfobacillus harzensis TaxID=2729629 RepID=A0A7Y0L2Q7_9FIRM|nr:hypothetical protein [Sulfobacillus harzensis]NMP22221.1 hypothetical protein [Sulfobacillus harzensis]
MTDQDQDRLNREIAETLVKLGFDDDLCWAFQFPSIRMKYGPRPHDFTDPCYLLPAVEAWQATKEEPVIKIHWVASRNEWFAEYEGHWGHHRNRTTAERNAFHAAVTAD